MKKNRLIYIIYYLSILLYIYSIFSNNNLGLLIIFIYTYGYKIQNKIYREGRDLLGIIKINIYVILLVFLINLIYYKFELI